MKTTVIEIPVELKSAIEHLVTVATKASKTAEANRRLDCMRLEESMRDAARAVEVAGLELVVQAADVAAPFIRVSGKTLFEVGRFATTYHFAAGPVAVERSLYREVRNGPTFDPIAMKMGLVSRTWSPGAASQMAYLLARGTSREAEETARQLGRLPFSRSSFERIAHVVGELYVIRHADIDQELIEAFEMPEGAAGIAVSIDRVSVPMEEPIPGAPARTRKKRRKPRKGAKGRRGRKRAGSKKRRAKRVIERNYRMAYCGALTIVDNDGETLHTIRYGRMAQGDAIDLVEGLASDVMALRDQRKKLAVTLVLDGAHELWNLVDQQLNEKALGIRPHRLIDLFHFLEKLHEAAKAIHGEGEAKAVLRRWKLRLMNAKTAAKTILAELRASANDTQAVHDAITYIENAADRMDYATAREQGRPVGSGSVEATCKSLVAMRMKRPGARWKEDTGEHIIQLRALALSDRWDAALRLTLEPLRRAVRTAA